MILIDFLCAVFNLGSLIFRCCLCILFVGSFSWAFSWSSMIFLCLNFIFLLFFWLIFLFLISNWLIFLHLVYIVIFIALITQSKRRIAWPFTILTFMAVIFYNHLIGCRSMDIYKHIAVMTFLTVDLYRVVVSSHA